MSRPINENVGIVKRVSKNKTKITIETPLGGTFECRNEGFEVGEHICFLLDALQQRVIKVLPKEVADIKWEIGQSEELQNSIMEYPEGFEVILEEEYFEFSEEYLEEVASYGTDDNDSSEGWAPEGSIDFSCGENRNIIRNQSDYFADPAEISN